MTPMRSASAKASSWSCVTSTVVMPSSRCTCADGAAQLLADLGVERAEGLVEQQHLGLVRQRARDRDALLLAAGELGRQALVHALERDELQQLLAPGHALGAASCAARAARIRCCPPTVMWRNSA